MEKQSVGTKIHLLGVLFASYSYPNSHTYIQMWLLNEKQKRGRSQYDITEVEALILITEEKITIMINKFLCNRIRKWKVSNTFQETKKTWVARAREINERKENEGTANGKQQPATSSNGKEKEK